MRNFFLKGVYVTVSAFVVIFLAVPFVKASLISEPQSQSQPQSQVQTTADKDRAAFYESVNSFLVVQDKTKKPTKDDIINAASLMAFVAGTADTIGAHIPPHTTLTQITEEVVRYALADIKKDSSSQIVIAVLRQKYNDPKFTQHSFLEVGGFVRFVPPFLTVEGDMQKGIDSNVTSWVGAVSFMSYIMGVLDANSTAFGQEPKHQIGQCTSAVTKTLVETSKSLSRKEWNNFGMTPMNLVVTAACF